MVVVLQIDCLKNKGELGEMGERNGCSVAFGMEMPLAEVDCLIVAGRSLWEPLGLGQRKEEYSEAGVPTLSRNALMALRMIHWLVARVGSKNVDIDASLF